MSNLGTQEWLDRFFASYYRHRPVNATFIGEHALDYLLPDYSQAGVEAALADADTLLREADAVAAQDDDPIAQMDLRMARGYLRVQQWEFASHHFQAGNPAIYTGEALFGVIGLLLTDFAPAAQRAEAVVARLYATSGLLAQAVANIHAAPDSWIERARRECAGARALLGPGIERAAASMGVAPAPLRAAADDALAAFAAFEGWLHDGLQVAPATVAAAGGEVIDLLLREGHAMPLTGDDIVRYAEEQLAITRERLAAEAARHGSSDWQQAMARLADIHPSRQEYLSRYSDLWAQSRALVEAQGLLTWPDFPIDFQPQPVWARAAAPFLYFLFYRAPAAFERPPVHHYLVTPIDADMPEGEQQRRLRATNESVIKLNHVVHHGGVGHHVQNWHAYHGRSRIGQVAAVDCASRIALFCGGTMAEGWACYATTLMGEAGFLTPLETVSELQTDLRMACRAIVDVRLHQGRLSLAEAAAFYAEQTGMHREAAMGEAVKISMFPGAALIYLMGRDRILELRAEMQQRLGAAFNLRTFHDQFLSYGSLPVDVVADAMLAATEPKAALNAQ